MEIPLMQQSPSSPQHTKVRDVWNHASFLVKVAYDLEWAARQFELLESEAPNRQIKAILLLNIGITYTLLADYQRAEKAFRKVLPLHPFTAPLAHFFLGLVRFELTDYEQAQISFKLCACVLRQTDWNRDYRCLGLDFTLSHLLVVENEEIAAYEWTLKQKGRYGYRLLNRLPAPSTFDTTVLNDLPEFYCKRVSRSTTDCSATSLSSASSSYSRNVSSIMMAPDRQALELVSSLRTPTPPLIPRRPVPRRPMVPRTAQAERSDLSSLAQFLKYTGPDTARVERTNNPSVPLMSAARPNNASRMGSRFSSSSEDLNQDPTPSDRNASRVESSGLLRKFSSRTLKK
ncbi:unnamed protein product [Aureobasidium pullulans]|nr:unnamed protein product [Aureobasidium pullulans]